MSAATAPAGRVLALATGPFVVGSLSRVAVQLLAFAQVVVASRHLDLAQFGTFALASAIAVIACSLLYTGFYEGLLRARDVAREAPTVLVLLCAVGIGLGLAMGVAALAFGFETGFETGFGAMLLPLALVPVLAGPTAWCEALGVRRGMVRANAVLTLVAEGAGFAALLWGLRAGEGAMALVWGRLVATLAALLLKLPFALGAPALGFSRAVALAAWQRARPLYAGAVAKLLSGYGGDFVVALFLSPAAVGAFRAGARVANTGAEVIVRPIHAIAWSRFARLERDLGAAAVGPLQTAWLRDTAFLAAVAWPSLVGLALMAEPVTALVLGPAWIAAAPVIAALALARAVAATDFLVDPLLVCRGRSDLQMRLRVASAALSVACVALAAPFGVTAAALGLLAAAVATLILAVALGARVLTVSWRELLPAFRPAILLTGLVVLTATAADALAAGWVSPVLALSGVVVASGTIWLCAVVLLLSRGRLFLPSV